MFTSVIAWRLIALSVLVEVLSMEKDQFRALLDPRMKTPGSVRMLFTNIFLPGGKKWGSEKGPWGSAPD